MAVYVLYDILKLFVIWKIWQRGPLTAFWGASDGLDPALLI